MLYLISPFIWLAPPLLFRLTHPGVNPEQAYILAGKAVLPAGMIGLMVAAMFSSTASTVSGHLNVFSGVLANDVYRRFESMPRKKSSCSSVGSVLPSSAPQ